MQALHRKLDVVLVQILRSETDYIFCEDLPPAALCPLPGCGFHRQTPSVPPLFFCSAAPGSCPETPARERVQSSLLLA